MGSTQEFRDSLDARYRRLLLDGIAPFWLSHGIDWEYGGVRSCMTDSGELVSRDKFIWSQARSVWTFAALYNRIEKRPEFLEVAKNSLRFLLAHGRDDRGRWVYHTDREGRVIEGATSIYSDKSFSAAANPMMHMTSLSLTLGVTFAVVAGIMNGTFTLPMRFLGRWSWENVWALFIVVSCVAMPIAVAYITIPEFVHVLDVAPLHSELIAAGTGFAWGFGAIMFGQGVSAIGISMGNTLVLAISASLGSFIPILVLDPHRLALPQGKMIVLGTVIGIGGIVSCGYAGFLKERSQKDQKEVMDAVRGEMVGKARPFRIGLLLCVGSGLLSAVFNIGYSASQEVIRTATHLGYSAFAGSNVIWLLMLCSGAVANLIFCGYLLRKNGTWSKYAMPGSAPLYAMVIAMGLMWGGSVFLYGYASPKLGRLGPAIGWPLLLIVGLVTANFWGFVTGEWRSSRSRALQWMFTGLAVLLIAIITLGWSSALA